MSNKTDFQIHELIKYQRSIASKADQKKNDYWHQRETKSKQIFRDLQQKFGYGIRWDINKIGRKEFFRYVDYRIRSGIAHPTIKNDIRTLRYLARTVGLAEDKIPSNKDLGLKSRILGKNQAIKLTKEHLDKMDDGMKIIARSKSDLGLREKEAIKINYREASEKKPGKICLDGPWCKNGRYREMDITTDKQRQIIKDGIAYQDKHGYHSMIPTKIATDNKKFNKEFRNYQKKVSAKTKEVGIVDKDGRGRGHGLRHDWAHNRFKQIAGFPCPIAGGPQYSTLSPEDQKLWNKAAAVVNMELGHGKDREDTTATYIGAKN